MLTSSALRSPSACMTAPWCWSSTSAVTNSIGSWRSPSSSWKTTRGLRHRELVALAAHVLEQDRQVQLAAAGDLEDAVLVGVLAPSARRCDCSSRSSRSRICRLVTNLPSRPASGELLTQKFIVSVGSSTCSIGSGSGSLEVGERHADADVLDAVDQHDVARAGLGRLLALQAFELQHLVDARLDRRRCPGRRRPRRPASA